MESNAPIGIVAGKGLYPKLLLQAIKILAPNRTRFVIGFKGETDPDLRHDCEVLYWFNVGQLSKPIRTLKKANVKEVIMAGQITPNNLFKLRPDLRALKLLSKLKETNADSLFGAIADELESSSIHVLPAITYMENYLTTEGHLFGPKPKAKAIEDITYGYSVAQKTSSLDIGQTCIVRNGTILAVEAFEGTNDCITRGGALGHGKNVTMVKVAKHNHDFRFDVPVIGATTVKKCAEAGINTIALEAGRTLILEPEAMKEMAKERKISIYGIKSSVG